MSFALDICSLERWTALCQNLKIETDKDTYGALIKAHAEPHRAYHTLDHIAACLRHLDDVREQTDRPDEIEMALWFHDAVYAPFSATNEEDSAEWAADWLQERGLDKAATARIADYILETKSHDAPSTLDGRSMINLKWMSAANIAACRALFLRRNAKLFWKVSWRARDFTQLNISMIN